MNRILTLTTACLITLASISQEARLWGVTIDDGTNSTGTVYSVDKSGNNLQVHHNFEASLQSGSNGPLVLASNGKLYGNHPYGCANDAGGIFSIDPTNDQYVKLFDYDSTLHGYSFWAAGFKEFNNKLYTVSYKGGANDKGALISFDLSNNTVTNLFDFDLLSGYQTYAELQLLNGELFGVTQKGGSNDDGVIFKYNIENSTYSVLHNFEDVNGDNPNFEMTLVGDSLFYGTTRSGGSNGEGVIYSFDPSNNSYTNLISFDNYLDAPNSKLVYYDNGLYGVTRQGGVDSDGSLFKYNISTNQLYELYSFNATLTGQPWFSSPILSYPNLIGATGLNNDGGVYQFNLIDSTFTMTETFDVNSGSVSRGYFIEVCLPSFNSITEVACQSYTSPSGKIWTQTGMYTDTIANTFGCDSIISIDLTVNTLDLTILNTGSNLVSSQTTGSYLWYDCDGDSSLVNETNQFFTPPSTGNYAVILDENGCTDTSDCENFIVLTIESSTIDNVFIYPNPSKGEFRLTLIGKELKEINILDTRGLLIRQLKSNQEIIDFDLSNVDPGIYFLVIKNGKEKTTKKLIIR